MKFKYNFFDLQTANTGSRTQGFNITNNKAAIRHNMEPVSSTYDPHNLSPEQAYPS